MNNGFLEQLATKAGKPLRVQIWPGFVLRRVVLQTGLKEAPEGHDALIPVLREFMGVKREFSRRESPGDLPHHLGGNIETHAPRRAGFDILNVAGLRIGIKLPQRHLLEPLVGHAALAEKLCVIEIGKLRMRQLDGHALVRNGRVDHLIVDDHAMNHRPRCARLRNHADLPLPERQSPSPSFAIFVHKTRLLYPYISTV